MFRLIYYNLHERSWKVLGNGLGETKTLQKLVLNACNLNDGNNCDKFFSGMARNRSLESVDLSDCNLTDQAGTYLVRFFKA